MKHLKKGRKLGRVRKVRVALMRSLARSLILKGRITTTIAKARELRPYVEKLITLAGKGTLASHKLIISRMGNDKESASKLTKEIAPKYKERPGGYTRITKLGTFEDAARDKAVIELV
mgnify:CR=1 FL=1